MGDNVDGWVVVRGPQRNPKVWAPVNTPVDTAESAIRDAQRRFDEEVSKKDYGDKVERPFLAVKGHFRYAIRRASHPHGDIPVEFRATALARIAMEMMGLDSDACRTAIEATENLGDIVSTRPSVVSLAMALGDSGKGVAAWSVFDATLLSSPQDEMEDPDYRYKVLVGRVEACTKILAWSWRDRPGATEADELARARLFFQAIRAFRE